MKARPQVAAPCTRKGDLQRGPRRCECMASCKTLKGFKTLESIGTLEHQRSQKTSFQGCLQIDESLIKENLIRYETREPMGMEVLFEGIESTFNLNSEIFIDDDDSASFDSYIENRSNILLDTSDNDRKLKKATFQDRGVRKNVSHALGYAQSLSNAIWADPAKNLQEAFFRSMFVRGFFDRQTDDIHDLATCLYHGVDIPSEMKKVWPRYTEKRYQQTVPKVWALVYKRMPSWAQKFERIWELLTDAQAEALKEEWFFEEDEKPTQEEIAKKLGISLASYQERLQWAYRKLETLYPEFSRKKDKDKKDPKKIYPLYEILPSGEKVEIKFPKIKDKEISVKEKIEIRNWISMTTTNYMFTYDEYSDVEDIEDEQEQEEVEEFIEKEHQDYTLIKAEELESNKVAIEATL